MPRLGWSMEVGSLVEWVKREGELVKVGDIICRIEGDKAVDDVEAFDGGILRIPPTSPRAGEKVPVGTLLAYLLAPGEKAPFELAGQTATAAPRQPSAPAAADVAELAASPRGTATVASESGGMPSISPRARRVATELGVDWSKLAGSGSTGRIVERDVRLAAADAAAQLVETSARI